MFTSVTSFTSSRRFAAPALLAASVLLAGTVLTACSDESGAATADKGTGDSASSPDSSFDRALEYAQCMRDNGVPDFPDPQQDSGGVRISPGGDPNAPEHRKAQEACRDKMPQGRGGGGSLDSAKVAAWAECIRENGLPEFPDPEIDGGNMVLDLGSTGIKPEDIEKPRKECQDKYPGGGMMVRGGGGAP
ncbi:hypothetical protein [Streptomyces lycii]|uniref:Lipoprotein n=1 Tax=Streptomyces lycii TaxID=2654337 RepID=A0ABQ7FLH7_9ACTN|nr:hypothetical protein [Streptomyces lycii]KAF4409214.1 hypothetical protein GCU69_10135 [Streptomyces lycii]